MILLIPKLLKIKVRHKYCKCISRIDNVIEQNENGRIINLSIYVNLWSTFNYISDREAIKYAFCYSIWKMVAFMQFGVLHKINLFTKNGIKNGFLKVFIVWYLKNITEPNFLK